MPFPISTRTGSSASATSWCASGAVAPSGSISVSPLRVCWRRVVGVAAGVFPLTCLAALLAVPLLVASARRAFPTFEQPRHFVAAIRSIVACYVVAVGLFTVGILLRAWH